MSHHSSERYVCTLSPKLLQRAVREINEPDTDEARWKAIDDLKSAFDGEPFRNDDLFFLKFLRAKKFDRTKALRTLRNYHAVRAKFRHLFYKVDNPILLKYVGDKAILCVLDGHAHDGSRVMLYRPGLLDRHVDLNDLSALCVHLLERLLDDEHVQVCGLSTLEDLANFELSILLQISVAQLRRANTLWLDAIPMRLTHAHIVNEGRFFDAALVCLRPFLPAYILARVELHGRNYYGMRRFIDPAYLPPYLHGTGRSLEFAAMDWKNRLVTNFKETSI